MSGHGHVTPNPNGMKARCGGPGLCSVCSAELAQKKTVSPPAMSGRISETDVRRIARDVLVDQISLRCARGEIRIEKLEKALQSIALGANTGASFDEIRRIAIDALECA